MFDASPDPSPSTFRAGFFLVHFECDAAQSHFALLLTQALAPLAVQKLIRTSMETHRTALLDSAPFYAGEHSLTVALSRSLYRRCLKLSLDWAVHRHVWRGQAMYIRSLFEQNRRVLDPRQQKARVGIMQWLFR